MPPPGVCLRDSSSLQSYRTQSTERSSIWRRTFDFDREIIGSRVYQAQFRSLMRYIFGKWKTIDSPAKFTTIRARTKKEQDDKGKGPHTRQGQGLVLLLGSHECGKTTLLNSIQSYQATTKHLERQKIYKTRIIARTCQEFQMMLNNLQSDIDLSGFEEIRKETQLVLAYNLFVGPVTISRSFLSKHDFVKERTPSRRIKDRLSGISQ